MLRSAAMVAVALSSAAFAFDSRVQWMKFDSALAQAGVTGKPICVYVAVNPNGSS